MTNTLVLQSHRQPLSEKWLVECIDSVKNWANENSFKYKFISDELFNYVSDEIVEKTQAQPVIATDLARLKALQHYLYKGFETVIWCDADFLIFAPKIFKLPLEKYAVGREVWIQSSDKHKDKLKAHIKVHNAFLMFRKDNSFLDFYTDTAERLLLSNSGNMPPQYIGPKLLTAIHNVAQCPVLESAGMLSPLVIEDIAKGGGSALELFMKKSTFPIAAANLCNSLFERDEYSTSSIESCITALKADKCIIA